MQTIVTLKLGGNEISAEGVEQLANFLRNNTVNLSLYLVSLLTS